MHIIFNLFPFGGLLEAQAWTFLFQDGETIPGGTETILLMGVLIVLIIVIPIVLERRRWMR